MRKLPESFKELLSKKLGGDWLEIDNNDYEAKITAILDILSGMTIAGDDELENVWQEIKNEVSLAEVERYLRWVAFDEE